MRYEVDHVEIRDAITKLCETFDGSYWRDCDSASRYPSEFVNALTKGGYLSALSLIHI